MPCQQYGIAIEVCQPNSMGSRSRYAVPTVWDCDRVEVCVCTNANDADTHGWLTFDFILNFRKKYNTIYVVLPYLTFYCKKLVETAIR